MITYTLFSEIQFFILIIKFVQCRYCTFIVKVNDDIMGKIVYFCVLTITLVTLNYRKHIRSRRALTESYR